MEGSVGLSSTSPKKKKKAGKSAAEGGHGSAAEVPLAEAKQPAAIMCIYCAGFTAAVYCEQCLDSFCSACYASIHRAGKLTRHTSYEVEQPEGIAANTELFVPFGNPLEEVAKAKSVGEELIARERLKASGDVRQTEGMTEDQIEEQKKRAMRTAVGEGQAEEKVTLGEISRYIKRTIKLGSIPASLQMKVSLQPKEAVLAAAYSLLTPDAAHAAGGWNVLKNQKPDAWMSGVSVKGAGIEKYL
jgi:hypothetical protein